MTNSASPSAATAHPGDANEPPDTASQKLSVLSSLLENLEEAPQREGSSGARANSANQNRLIQVRLGIASALFAALRAKHPPTAAHALRVALGCSSWALSMNVSEDECDEIEVAALLHDIGKIGVPDVILRKPGKLSHDESSVVDHHRQSGLEILSACSASREILDMVYYATAWFDGSRKRFDRWGEQLPLGSRMIGIVDAFDAMTTDSVYRRALSRDRALAELFECAGTQFDPALVKSFCTVIGSHQGKLSSEVSRRWLKELHPEASNALWCLGRLSGAQSDISIDAMFQQKLVDSMDDGVVFVDQSLKILLWNRAAERLTGIQASSVLQKQWSPNLVQMRDENELDLTDADCPIAYSIKSTVQTMRRLTIAGRGNQRVSVDAHMVPVVGRDGVLHGATMLLHDASSRITLEARVESLHAKATQDPLTKVSNRAEFDRMHSHFVESHLELGLPCSLMISDLDFFKRINDTYGHQAGDEALVSFAALLKRFSRQGDLVARYGGEEFVMLCADCDNATATSRAEAIRVELQQLPQPSLGGKTITASFGVTEIQAGDTPETMFRRADRALLQAKDMGRNMVVQLGSGIAEEERLQKKSGWLSWFRTALPDQLMQRTLITAVPLKVAAEKLRGFVADHHAEITSIQDDHIVVRIEGQSSGMIRRRNDRPVPFLCELKFEERQGQISGRTGGASLRTLINVAIRPIRNRDRRRGDVVERARQLLVSLKSYLMAQDYAASGTVEAEQVVNEGVLNKAKNIFRPLFQKN